MYRMSSDCHRFIPLPSSDLDANSDSTWFLTMTSTPKTTLVERIRSYLYEILLFVSVAVLTPMWLMALCLTLYFYLLHWSWRIYVHTTSLIPLTLLLLYALHILTDRKGPQGYFARNHPQWTSYLRDGRGFFWTAQYFPVFLHKTVDLPPGPYLFLYHPHGVIGMGSNAALNTNACDFERVFPGIVRYGVTLPIAFSVPFIRDYMVALGYIHSRRGTLERILSQQKESVVIVPGGAPEALYTQSGTFRCVLKTAPLRLAHATGATIVPCLGFGENDAFAVYTPGHRVQQVQQWLCRVLSFSTPILQSPFPQRRPIHVVVGAPLLPKTDDGGNAYRAAVDQLYNEHKGRYGHADIPLEWIPSPSSASSHHQQPELKKHQ
jgi:Diacylglycerol acyltransferase